MQELDASNSGQSQCCHPRYEGRHYPAPLFELTSDATTVNCSKTSVLIENVISSISITSSPSFTVQITGKTPTIQLDSTDGGQIYLSPSSAAEVEITSAKCSAINVSIPVKNEKGEEEEGLFVERAMPEMLRTVIQNRQLVSSIIEPSG
jgi:adenylyl cyclase-associated protein